MIQKIENIFSISVKERSPTGQTSPVNLTGATHILFAIKQRFGQYIELEAEFQGDTLIAKLPYEKAMMLTNSPTEVQLMWTDANGNKWATKAKPVPVDVLLREAGYD